MIGWHYTSWENWRSIRTEGLRPYPMNHPEEFLRNCVDPIGIWIYAKRQRGKSHRGCIFWQMLHKHTFRVVLLRVEFDRADLIRTRYGDKVILQHNLDVDPNSDRHKRLHERELALVIANSIPPCRIKLAGVYGLGRVRRKKMALKGT